MLKFLYGEIRNLIGYFKENHSDLFRKMAFSCMIEPYVRMHQAANVNKLKARVCDRKLKQLSEWRARVQTVRTQILGEQNSEASNASANKDDDGEDAVDGKTTENPLLLACDDDVVLLDSIEHKLVALRANLLDERIYLDSRCLVRGLSYYRFFMDSLPPASIPDASFMAAFLELDAPILAKAAFLLQTAHFVHKCSRKEWPEWLKSNLGPVGIGAVNMTATATPASPTSSYSYHGNNSKSPMSHVTRRNRMYQLAAASMFATWAEVLADQLDSLLNTTEATAEASTAQCASAIGVEDYFVDGKRGTK